MKITIVGAGAWGSALSLVLRQNNHSVTLWAHDPNILLQIQRSGQNPRLPGVAIPKEILLQSALQLAIQDAEALVIAVPSKAFREVTQQLAGFTGLVVSVTKGIEYDSGLTMCGVLAETIPKASAAALSGPSLAMEVAKNIPTACVAANHTEETARVVQKLFHCANFRVYTSTDVAGVELGGALKNPMAIGAGVCDGLGFGDNAKAALITRGVVELRRLGAACGAQPETFNGLSGLGDLVVTCFSRLSRNRGFGERLGRGEKVEHILNTLTSVAEGHPTAKSAYQLARKLNIQTPILDEVYAMLYQGKNVAEALHSLMERHSKPESD